MKQTGIYSEHAVEIIFCLLRWLIFLIAISIFVNMYLAGKLLFPVIDYAVLSFCGFLYMLGSMIIILKWNPASKVYHYTTRAAVVFDYLAFLPLIVMTGGINSVLLSVSFLIIMHAAVYWRVMGGLLAGILLAAGCAVIGFQQGMALEYGIPIHFIFKAILLVIVGFLNGLIISRERFLTDRSRQLQEIVILDPLTELFNHRYFHERTDALLEGGIPFFLVMGDVDFFKQINDIHGHKTGDYVLKYIGKKIKECLPKGKGMAFRYGGEEFSVLCLTDKQTIVEEMLESLKFAFERLPFSDKISVTMSFGVAFSGQVKLGTDELINRADKCLYEAKENGRNRAVFYSG